MVLSLEKYPHLAAMTECLFQSWGEVTKEHNPSKLEELSFQNKDQTQFHI